ncbi:putative disease resistance RPP13-like protein 1 isoform X2 [Pyrus x bretschneideri]|nr:putative disease resistance RPP13-like protein 1 isoform X2 [Pyrus x bretschneideri]
MGGVGKTTLAQLLYNDKKINEYFDVKAWACVSEDFDAVRVTKDLLGSITSEPCEILDMSLLRVELREQVRGKKFLFVLDDLWNENSNDWDLVRAPFTYGARGSKVIVTTRDAAVASTVHTLPIHYLKLCSDKDCWLLLAKHAFRNENSPVHPDLEEICKKIASKCRGLPLAAKALGGLLGCKVGYKEWSHILNNNLWNEFDLDKKTFEITDHLAKLKDVLGLKERAVRASVSSQSPTSPIVVEDIFGRDEEKEKLKALLLSDDASSGDISVIPIVGRGGVGKTTLAQLLYNDNRVKEYFDVRAWVCVSQDFDPIRVTKTLLESIASKPVGILDVILLQEELREQIRGKKFLFVLDDLGNDNYNDWNFLQAPFTYGARGSRVIVTTRSTIVASLVHTESIHHSKPLSTECYWLLLAKHAFGNENPSSYPELEGIGKQLARECCGMPLVARALGGLLQCSTDVKEWNRILYSLQLTHDNILVALRLSYHYLPSHLKQCFAYCSIFPKSYEFKKEDVALLWIAEGLVPQSGDGKRMEEVALQYFDELLSRSLFQRSGIKSSVFTMHDLINDLAMSMSKEICCRLEGEESNEVPERIRHISYVKEEFDVAPKFESLYRAKCLRTFLPLASFWHRQNFISERIPLDLLPALRSLRVFSLSGYKNVTELPNSIGNLISLRYINLSHTGIRRLPDRICTLYNLQTLLLSHCFSLIELPADMQKLINLRHVDISGTNIKDMPLRMGRLKSLRKLTTFVVGKSTGASIRELGELSYIEGKLSILKLQDRVDAEDALQANLKDKKGLKELTLGWRDGARICKEYHNHRDVLDKLQPPINLEKLTIKFYVRNRFPSWLGDSSFSHVQFMHISQCSCRSLPSLGQLPALKVLFIGGMNFLAKVGPQFYGDGSSLIQPFQRLEKLIFMEMPEWEDWLPSGGQSSVFPRLEELVLKKCPKLRGNLPNHLPSLKKLCVSGCGVLHERATTTFNVVLQQSFEELTLDGCPILLSLLGKEFLTSLQKLEIGNIVNIEGLLNNMVHNSNHLQKLSIWNCPFLTLFPSDRLPSTLTTLHLQECPSLLSFPRDGLPSMLKSLEITNCRKLEFLAHELIPKFPYLTALNLSCSCDSLRSFPLGLFPQLRDLSIRSCVNLESLSFEAVDGKISHLKSLSVFGCKNLRSFPKQLHAFNDLRELRISALPNLESVAEEGLPLNLEVFEVCYCDKLKPSAKWRLEESFLRQFSIGGRGSEDLFGMLLKEKLLPTTLKNLYIYGLPSLKSFDGKGLQHLTSLKRLQIHCCDNLEFLPEEGLPISLSFLSIERCSSLKKRYQNKRGDDWSKIAGIPCIKIDEKVII